jgi:hypothetical protein
MTRVTMTWSRAARFAATLIVLVAAASCARESATAPGEPNASLLGGLRRLTGALLTCSPLPFATDSALIGPLGGTLNLGAHSFTVPRGALTRSVWIKGEAPSDTVNSVRFYPAGLTFSRPATLTMSYSNCNLVAGLLTPKRIAYTTEGLVILSYLPSVDNLLLREVTGSLDHFSRYALAW